MQAQNFDFDVVTGPSTPQQEREEQGAQDQSEPPPAESRPVAPRTR